jgi:hypothetical protein
MHDLVHHARELKRDGPEFDHMPVSPFISRAAASSIVSLRPPLEASSDGLYPK